MREDNSEIKTRVLQAITERVFPGCVIGVSQNQNREILARGSFTYETDSPRVTRDTVFDLASVTKSIPTASLALVLISEGRLRLEDKVVKYIPELLNDHGATIEDLLRYRVHGERMSELRFKTFEQIRTHLLENGFDGPPGVSSYSNLPAFVLGIVLERVGGASIAALAEKHFFGPFGMKSTTFFPAASDCVPTEVQSGKIIQGVVHDDSARIFAQGKRTVGHAGLFSTAEDLLAFSEAVMNNGFQSILGGAENGLGWTVNQEWFMGSKCGPRTFGKTGFTGTSILIDSAKKTALVILSNRTYPSRPTDATSLTSAINLFRRDIADIVFA